MSSGKTPTVTVLMATYNGREWLPEQVASVLDQGGVQVRLVVSDDGSKDGTWEWLQELADGDDRVRLLERQAHLGSAAANFYRLIGAHDPESSDFVALSDQDDIWLPGKLAAQTQLLTSGELIAVSSDVTAFDDQGHRRLLRKSYPQQRFDYLFESAGPGSTFLVTPALLRLVQQQLAAEGGPARAVEAHDWLIYGIGRAAAGEWFIQPRSWVDYRQHDDNELGANTGVRSALWRLKRIKQGWHRQQVIAMTEVALAVAPTRELRELHTALTEGGLRNRATLLKRCREFRRYPRDRALLAAMIAVGLW